MILKTTRVWERLNNIFTGEKKYRFIICRGGTRSTKTYSICQHFVWWLWTGDLGVNGESWINLKQGIISVVRKHKSSLQGSVIRDIEEILENRGLVGIIKYNKTRRIFSYQGRILEFLGADQQKSRGLKRDILYCNEANELDYKTEFFQLNVRTTTLVIIDFNPDNENVWINKELEEKKFKRGDIIVDVSTYLDNPFLTPEQIKAIESYKDDPEAWKVWGLGQYGKVQGVVYEKYETIGQVPKDAEYLGSGLDFGFTNDPTALVHIYRYNGNLIVDEEIYQTGLTNSDLDKKVRENGLDPRKLDVVADSAEPKSIEELKRLGWNIQPAQKGADSINHGIQTLKQFPLQITAKSTNILKEIKVYKWQEKDGKPTNKPIDKFNHGLDALRYIADYKLGKKQKKLLLISN